MKITNSKVKIFGSFMILFFVLFIAGVSISYADQKTVKESDGTETTITTNPGKKPGTSDIKIKKADGTTISVGVKPNQIVINDAKGNEYVIKLTPGGGASFSTKLTGQKDRTPDPDGEAVRKFVEGQGIGLKGVIKDNANGNKAVTDTLQLDRTTTPAVTPAPAPTEKKKVEQAPTTPAEPNKVKTNAAVLPSNLQINKLEGEEGHINQARSPMSDENNPNVLGNDHPELNKAAQIMAGTYTTSLGNPSTVAPPLNVAPNTAGGMNEERISPITGQPIISRPMSNEDLQKQYQKDMEAYGKAMDAYNAQLAKNKAIMDKYNADIAAANAANAGTNTITIIVKPQLVTPLEPRKPVEPEYVSGPTQNYGVQDHPQTVERPMTGSNAPTGNPYHTVDKSTLTGEQPQVQTGMSNEMVNTSVQGGGAPTVGAENGSVTNPEVPSPTVNPVTPQTQTSRTVGDVHGDIFGSENQSGIQGGARKGDLKTRSSFLVALPGIMAGLQQQGVTINKDGKFIDKSGTEISADKAKALALEGVKNLQTQGGIKSQSTSGQQMAAMTGIMIGLQQQGVTINKDGKFIDKSGTEISADKAKALAVEGLKNSQSQGVMPGGGTGTSTPTGIGGNQEENMGIGSRFSDAQSSLALAAMVLMGEGRYAQEGTTTTGISGGGTPIEVGTDEVVPVHGLGTKTGEGGGGYVLPPIDYKLKLDYKLGLGADYQSMYLHNENNYGIGTDYKLDTSYKLDTGWNLGKWDLGGKYEYGNPPKTTTGIGGAQNNVQIGGTVDIRGWEKSGASKPTTGWTFDGWGKIDYKLNYKIVDDISKGNSGGYLLGNYGMKLNYCSGCQDWSSGIEYKMNSDYGFQIGLNYTFGSNLGYNFVTTADKLATDSTYGLNQINTLGSIYAPKLTVEAGGGGGGGGSYTTTTINTGSFFGTPGFGTFGSFSFTNTFGAHSGSFTSASLSDFSAILNAEASAAIGQPAGSSQVKTFADSINSTGNGSSTKIPNV